MSLRALYVRVKYLPPDDYLWTVVEATEVRNADSARARRLREKQARYSPRRSA